jgi:hypothetical protein
MSATTKLKVLSPEIHPVATGQGFHFLEARNRIERKGEFVTGMPGSKSVAGIRTAYIGTWESRSVSRSPQEAEKALKGYVEPAVGPISSRGVVGVMPGGAESSPERVGGLTQRGYL